MGAFKKWFQKGMKSLQVIYKHDHLIPTMENQQVSLPLQVWIWMQIDISFSIFPSLLILNHLCACVCSQSLSHVLLFAMPWTVAHQAPLTMEFLRQEYWIMLPFPTPVAISCFLAQGSKPHLLCLLHWQADSLLTTLVVQSLGPIQLFATPWTVSLQAPPSFTISWCLLKFMSIESMMLFNHFILYHPLLLLPSIFPSIKVFSNESALCIRWQKYWSFSISPSNEYSGFLLQRIFPTQGSNPGNPHCRQTLYQLSHQGSILGPFKRICPKSLIINLNTDDSIPIKSCMILQESFTFK